MPEQREFEDGCHYWVRGIPFGSCWATKPEGHEDVWTVGRCEDGLFSLPDMEGGYPPEHLLEIGPKIGKEPPDERMLRITVQDDGSPRSTIIPAWLVRWLRERNAPCLWEAAGAGKAAAPANGNR